MLWINAIDEISKDKTVVLRGLIGNFLMYRYGVKNLCLELIHEGEKIGETCTDKLGRFYIEYTFPGPGVYRILLRIKDFYALDTVINVLIIDEHDDREILVCDIDHTLVEFSMLAFLLRFALNEVDGSKEVLELLSKKYHVVYLTHREKRFSSITKRWLIDHDFPLGPVFFWSAEDDPFFSKKYKVHALKRIKEKAGLKLAVGIGDKIGDIEAYQSSGIEKRFLIRKNGDWKKIKEQLNHEFQNDQ